MQQTYLFYICFCFFVVIYGFRKLEAQKGLFLLPLIYATGRTKGPSAAIKSSWWVRSLVVRASLSPEVGVGTDVTSPKGVGLGHQRKEEVVVGLWRRKETLAGEDVLEARAPVMVLPVDVGHSIGVVPDPGATRRATEDGDSNAQATSQGVDHQGKSVLPPLLCRRTDPGRELHTPTHRLLWPVDPS